MKNIGFVLLIILFCWSCNNDDEGLNLNLSGISPAESFTDVRDGKVYKCIQVGDQIWMAENLNYYLPKGALDGCFTWEEPVYEVGSVAISEDKFQEQVRRAIKAGEIRNGIFLIMGKYEMEIGPAIDMEGWFKHGFTSEDIVEEIQYWLTNMSAFYNEDVTNAYKEGLVVIQRIIGGLVEETILSFTRSHFEKYDTESSGYSSTYGLLYSYEGALAAVPEGWRLPTDEDWKELEKYLGMNEGELNLYNKWRGQGLAAFLKEGEKGIGFDVLYGGCNAYTPENDEHYVRLGEGAYFWSSTLMPETDSTNVGIIRNLALYDKGIMRTTTKLKGHKPVLYSVRCIKKKDE